MSESPPERASLLPAAGQLFGLAAVALPAVGVGARLIAFSASPGFAPATRVALAASAGQLATTGFFCTIAGMLSALFLYALHRRDAPQSLARANLRHSIDSFKKRYSDLVNRAARHEPDDIEAVDRELSAMSIDFDLIAQQVAEAKTGLMRWLPDHLGRLVGILVVLALAMVALVLFMPGFPFSLITLAEGAAATMILERAAERTGRVSIAQTWPALAIIVVGSMFAGGLSFNVPGIDAANLKLRSGPAGGPVLLVGEADGLVYALPCKKQSNVLAIRRDEIESITFQAVQQPVPPSLYGILRGAHRPTGIQSRCP